MPTILSESEWETPEVRVMDAPNLWTRENGRAGCQTCGRFHCCYFCGPTCFPPMPDGHTLCARCGTYISIGNRIDPLNDAMFLCPPCEEMTVMGL